MSELSRIVRYLAGVSELLYVCKTHTSGVGSTVSVVINTHMGEGVFPAQCVIALFSLMFSMEFEY